MDKHGATDIFARKTVAYRTRLGELQDLLVEHAPVMNRAEEISAAQEALTPPPEPDD